MAAPITYKNFSYQFHSETLLGKLIRLPLRPIPKGMPISIRTGVARGMIWLTGAHVHGCFGIFSAAGYLLQDLQGQRIDPMNFPGYEFVAIPR